MSTKNVALDSAVYRRLADYKQESESFSKAVSRMLEEIENLHTGRDILSRLDVFPTLAQEDAEQMYDRVAEGREEGWEPNDLR